MANGALQCHLMSHEAVTCDQNVPLIAHPEFAQADIATAHGFKFFHSVACLSIFAQIHEGATSIAEMVETLQPVAQH